MIGFHRHYCHGLNLLCLLWIGICLWMPMASVEAREFTSKNGSVMQAELLSHRDGKVMLCRDDGKEFEVDPSIFAASDERFIRQWMGTRQQKIDYDFEVEIDRKVSNHRSSSSSSYTYWNYEIKIRNDSQDAVSDLKVQYRVLYATSRERVLEEEVISDQLLEFNRTLVVTTKPVGVYKYRSSYYGRTYRNGGLKGCVVRLLDRKGKVLGEYTSNEVSMKGVTWENCLPSAESKATTEIR